MAAQPTRRASSSWVRSISRRRCLTKLPNEISRAMMYLLDVCGREYSVQAGQIQDFFGGCIAFYIGLAAHLELSGGTQIRYAWGK
jgi:hypothetical protein